MEQIESSEFIQMCDWCFLENHGGSPMSAFMGFPPVRLLAPREFNDLFILYFGPQKLDRQITNSILTVVGF